MDNTIIDIGIKEQEHDIDLIIHQFRLIIDEIPTDRLINLTKLLNIKLIQRGEKNVNVLTTHCKNCRRLLIKVTNGPTNDNQQPN
jgi:hypothetical protein